MNHIFTSVLPEIDGRVITFFSGSFPKKHAFLSEISAVDRAYCILTGNEMKNEGDMKIFLLPEANKKICLVCIGDRATWSARHLRVMVRKMFQAAKSAKLDALSVSLEDFKTPHLSRERIAETIATNGEMAVYDFIRYREAPEDGWPRISTVSYYGKEKSPTLARAVEVGGIIGQEVNTARELANTPGGDMTPRLLAEEALKFGKEVGFKVQILGESEMKKLSMGGILGVSRGSSEEAQFIVMEYLNGPKTKKPIVFVGKGVTFDSGGLHLKPSNAMDEMHMDMSGGATVIAAIVALARMKTKVNIIGIVPAAENMVSGESYRPGDVLTSMSGKTIEVVSPDAEGRVILADALTFAKKYDPLLVVDVATLTGAVVVALGHHASAVMTPDTSLVKLLSECGEESGDYMWPLPIWKEYEADVKGSVGDILNAPKNREAGCINGGVFLYQFAKDFQRWAHVDIASTMTGSPDQGLAKGASGSGTRLLVEVARRYPQL